MIEGIPILDFTAPTLLGLAIVLLLTGKLIPRTMFSEKKEEAERWRKAYEIEREARSASDAQTAELMEVAKTTQSIIRALFNTTNNVPESGGANAMVPKE